MNWIQFILKLLGLYKPPTNTTTTSTVTVTPNGSTTSTTTMPVPNNTTTSTTTSGGKRMKVSLCMAINDYPGTVNDLQGCINDANDWVDYFKNYLKFDRVEVLLNSQETSINFENKVKELAALNPGVFVITNSSHGTSLSDIDGDEADGKDEAICMYDTNVVDDRIRRILNVVPETTDLIFFSDSCHSGTVTREFLTAMNDFTYASQPKYMPPADAMEAARLALLPVRTSVFTPKASRNEILFAGTTSDGYSYDASFNGRPNGAATYYWLKTLKANHDAVKFLPTISYEGFYNKVHAALPSSQYPQSPTFEPSNDALRTKLMFE